jgi:hypothetical protein
VGCRIQTALRNDHAVAQLVTDDRLHIAGEIRHEEPVGSASWRHRLSSRVDRLGHEPVAVEVQLAASARQRSGMASEAA